MSGRGGSSNLPIARLALVASVLLGAACGREAPGPQRWLDRPAVAALAASDLDEVRCTVRWAFEDGTLPPQASLLRGSVLAGLGGGLSLRGGEVSPQLELSGLGPEVDGLQIRLSGLRRGKLRLSAAAAPASAGAALELDAGAGTGRLSDRFLLDLRGRPGLAGAGRLVLEPTTAAGEIVTIAELCAGRIERDRERLAALGSRAWKVTLGSDARDALILPGDGRLEKRFVMPPDGELSFGVGALSGGSEGGRVEVELESEAGAPVPIGAGTLSGSGWSELRFPLGARAGREATVRIVARGGANAVWAVSTPTIASRERSSRRPNIVLISLDTLRADHLSLYGYGRPTSPNLDRWARERAVTFRRTVAPSGWTLPSHFSLFTGLDADHHAANYYRGALDSSRLDFLAELLWRAGYRTEAITGGGFVRPVFGLARGFERFRFWDRGFSDDELDGGLAAAGRFLDRPGSAPFFLFLHTYEIHAPNPTREPYFSRFSDLPTGLVADLVQDPPDPTTGFQGSLHPVVGERGGRAGSRRLPPELTGLLTDAYDSAIAHVDERLAPLLDRLSRPPFGGDTVVAIVSDHGESLAESGPAGHGYASLDNLLVPMILALPGRARGSEVAVQVRLHDLFPTLLELAGVEVPAGIDAISLAPLLGGSDEPGRTAYAYAASTNRGLVRLDPDGVKLEWLNSPWRPLAGGLRWLAVDGTSERPAEATIAGERAPAMVRELRSRYLRRITGLVLEVRTASPGPLRLEIESDLVDPVSTKTRAIDAPALDWVDIGHLRHRLTADSPLQLQFERSPRRTVGLAFRAAREGCAAAAETSVHAGAHELVEPRRLALEVPGCGGERPVPVEISLQWRGAPPAEEAAPMDAELESQLRALGYLQ